MSQGPGIGMVIDCGDPDALAPFWAQALGYTVLGSVDGYALLVPDGRDGPKLLLQRVPEQKAGKNRMHIDVEVADIEAEATRLEHLGATRAGDGVRCGFGCSWIVMADPEGNEFCVCDGGAGS